MRNLTDDEVIDIRKAVASGSSIRKLAGAYSKSTGAIQKIVTGKTHTKVGGPVSQSGVQKILKNRPLPELA